MGALIINHCSTIAASSARFFNHSSSSSLISSTTTTAIAAVSPISSSRLHMKSLAPQCFNAPSVRRSIIVKAASSSGGIDGSSIPLPDSLQYQDAPAVPIEIQNLPLESKQQLMLEQKLRMKLAKKIRLRRKRLVRKRQMRKKGRWPPSKVKKNKNV